MQRAFLPWNDGRPISSPADHQAVPAPESGAAFSCSSSLLKYSETHQRRCKNAVKIDGVFTIFEYFNRLLAGYVADGVAQIPYPSAVASFIRLTGASDDLWFSNHDRTREARPDENGRRGSRNLGGFFHRLRPKLAGRR